MNPPEWNSDDKRASLEQWIEMLDDMAREQYLSDGTHIEIFFVFGDEGLIEVVPVVGMEKNEIVRSLKQLLLERNGYAFIHIVEATAQKMDTADAADMLMLHAESRDGLSLASCSTVVMQGDKRLLLDPVRVDGNRIQGAFAGIFDSLDDEDADAL